MTPDRKHLIDYHLIVAESSGTLRLKVSEFLERTITAEEQAPWARWELAGPATYAHTPDGDWYTQTLARYQYTEAR